ncbi:MAG: hypothetical protein ACM3Q4_03605 [Acidobacteriota bacterium]
MKFTASLIAAAASALAFISTGCAVTESVSVQSIESTSPVAALPIRITDDAKAHRITISPHASWPSRRRITGLLELNEPSAWRSAPRDTARLLWNVPAMSGGVDVDYLLSDHAALAFGLGLSSLGSHTYGAWTAGFGLFNEKEHGAVRFDFGIHSTPVLYSAVSRVIRSEKGSPADTTYCCDEGEDSHINLFGALTLNTTRKTWPVNLFFHASVTKQRLIDNIPSNALLIFSDETGMRRVTSSHWMIGLTPGVIMSLMEDVRILVGERIMYPFDIMEESPYPLLQFHMQIDISI